MKNSINIFPGYMKWFLIILVVGMIFISGCQFVGPGGMGQRNVNYRIGVVGVTVEPYNSNPKQIYEKDPLQMGIMIKNLGSYNIDPNAPLRYTVTYNDYYINTTKEKRYYEGSFPLHRRDQYYPLGDVNYSEFHFQAKNLDSLREEIETEINYNICYPYATELTIGTCIDTRTSTTGISSSPCKLSEHTDRQGQGAPVAITRIVPEMLTVDTNTVMPQFRIYIENKGEGYTVDKTRPDVCADTTILNATNINRARVSATLSGKELNCTPTSILVLSGRDNVAKCFVKSEDLAGYKRNQKSYVALLSVKVDYGYVQVYNEKVKITRIDEITEQVYRCGPYEVFDPQTNRCESKCSYCARNNGNVADCTDNSMGLGIRITSGFSCSCTLNTCNSLIPSKQCGLGFCPGDQYCCNIDFCWNKADGTTCGNNNNNICVGGKCSNQNLCWFNYGQHNSNYSCMGNSSCNQSTIIGTPGLCGASTNVCCTR